MEEGDSEITDMITFVAEDEEFEIEKPIIMIHSLYVSDILDQIDSKSQVYIYIYIYINSIADSRTTPEMGESIYLQSTHETSAGQHPS